MRFGLLAAVMGVGLVATASVASAEICPDPIKVGWEDWPPFNIPGENEVKGIDPDIFRDIANNIGCEVTFVEVPWKRHLRKVELGEIDVAMAAAKTPERDKYSKWSSHYLPYSAILWVSDDDSNSYRSLEHFLEEGNTVGIIRGSTYGKEADELLKKDKYKEQVKPNKSQNLNIRLITADRLDGLIDNSLTTGFVAREEGLRTEIKESGVVVDESAIRYMFSKESVSDELVAAVDKAIEKLKADGTIQAIVDKYTGQTGS